MAEEVRDASKTVPRVMISTVILNGVLGFIMVVTFCYCITDLQAALNTTTGYPFIEVIYATTGSKTGTTVMVLIVIVLIICCAVSQLATASRQAFAFARDEGLPYSHVFSKVRTTISFNSVPAANFVGSRSSKSV
jgi:choline transport protein